MDMDTTNFTDLLSIVAAEAAAALPAPIFLPPPVSPTIQSAVVVNAHEVYSCTKCQQTFSGKGARQVHVRKTHQPKTILKHPKGLRIILERRPNGFFHCPETNCNYKTNDPWPVQAHYIRHFEHSSNSVREVQTATRSIDSEERSVLFDNAEDVDEEFCLSDMGYIRNTKLNIIICKSCRVCIQPRANLLFRHAKRLHHLNTITIPEIEKILESLDPSPCDEKHENVRVYMQASADKKYPVAGLQISCGWQCLICRQCSQKFTVMRKHFMMHHKGVNSKENSQPAFVQTLFGGKYLHYVRIDLKDSSIFPPPPATDLSISTNSGGAAQPSFIDADHNALPQPLPLTDVYSKSPNECTPFSIHQAAVQMIPGYNNLASAADPAQAAGALHSLSSCQDFQISEDNLFLAPDLSDDGLSFRNAFADDGLLDERLRLLVDSTRRYM